MGIFVSEVYWLIGDIHGMIRPLEVLLTAASRPTRPRRTYRVFSGITSTAAPIPARSSI